MASQRLRRRGRSLSMFGVLLYFAIAVSLKGQQAAQATQVSNGVHLSTPDGSIDVEMYASDLLRVDAQLMNKPSPRTSTIDPALKPAHGFGVTVQIRANAAKIVTDKMIVLISLADPISISIFDKAGTKLLQQVNPLGAARGKRVDFIHAPYENLYGMRGLDIQDNSDTILRNNGALVAAGAQGDGGAPFFFTKQYGVVVDSDGGGFYTQDDNVLFRDGSRSELEYFICVGAPIEVISGLVTVTGRPPMPPKWTLGFINSQWGDDQAEIERIAATYRQKHIPIDAFTLDYDWKAWGEDNYGEWRWNSTSGPGNVAPDKFPGGADGSFAAEMREQGFKLTGILKPRLIMTNADSPPTLHTAAAYADAHNFWYPNEPPVMDGGAKRPTRDVNFALPEARVWFWDHLKGAFQSGMIGWWNDEADHTWLQDGTTMDFNNFQFFNMGRMLYDGQRSISDLRVWSLNRNYYLGAQRYGYAEWSGDVQTGFVSMQHQRARMLSTLDIGEPHWSMDVGGFVGHPSDENYARWIEFATFVPIDRVHGTFNQKRQPWVYGPLAEKAATDAIRFRYKLLPYIYSFERVASETGVGIVRPLFWAFPDDPNVVDDSNAWMFGDSLLAAPVLYPNATSEKIYLPIGIWYDYFRGTKIVGGTTIDYPVNARTWADMPLFVREGGIVASQPVMDYVDQHPVKEVILDLFPGQGNSRFIYYDDDGTTYAYEKGSYYRQVIEMTSSNEVVSVDFAMPEGTFVPGLQSYMLKVHHGPVRNVRMKDEVKRVVSEEALAACSIACWTTGKDQFGSLIEVKVPAGQGFHVSLQ
jgi:alpha-glucosidase